MRHAVALVLGVLLLTIAADAQPPSPLVISGIAVVDVISGRIRPGMTVVVKGDRITRVLNSADYRIPSDARVVDGQGQFLIPGLWDMHVHLSYARASALPVLVANGVTTVRDLGSRLSELDSWRRQIAARAIVGPYIFRAGPMLNGQRFNRYQLPVNTGLEARAAVRSLHEEGVDLIKVHRRASREAYFAIAGESRRLGLPFAGHVPMTVSPAEASNAGQATLEHVNTLFDGTFIGSVLRRMLAWVTGRTQAQAVREWIAGPEAIDLFRTFAVNGTAVTPTLVNWSNLLTFLESNVPDPRDRFVAASAQRESDEIFRPMREDATRLIREQTPLAEEFHRVVALMNQAGVTLITGTDLSFASFIHPGFSLHEEMAQLVRAGLTPAEALRAATTNPAGVFPHREAGVIKAGKRADLVLLEGNPLADIRNTQKIKAVVLNGRMLDRKALDELLDAAAELAQRN